MSSKAPLTVKLLVPGGEYEIRYAQSPGYITLVLTMSKRVQTYDCQIS